MTEDKKKKSQSGEVKVKVTVREVEDDGVETQFSAVLAEAAKQYADSTGEKLDDFKSPPMRTIEDLIKQIDAQNNQFVNFRAKRQKVFSAMNKAMMPVEAIGSMIAEATKDAFPPAQIIYSSIAYLISAAHDTSSMYDMIIELFEKLEDFTSRLDIYLQHNLSLALRKKVVSILACLFEVMVIATKEVRRGRFKSYFKRLFGSSSPVQPALERLEELTTGEQRQVIAETYGGVSRLNTKMDRMESILKRSENRERENAVHQDRLKEILQPSPFPEDFYLSFQKVRTKNTGNWILEEEGWKSWLAKRTQYLFISGGAGTGKSFLTARLASWASENLTCSAYFFFRASNPETRSILQALRDIAYQLSESDPFYAKQLLDNLQSTDEIRTISSAYRKLLVQPFEGDLQERTIHLFLDGIDEAEPEEMDSLLQEFADGEDPQNEFKNSRCRIQLVLAGRSYMTETVSAALDPMGLGSKAITTLQITPENNAKDVQSFIRNGVFSSRNLRRTEQKFKWEVINAMEKQVGGLFILAKFMLEDISRKRHPSAILKSLASYPKEITGMLLRSLNDLSETISEDEAADLNEMLCWITCAEERLTLGQLEAALILKIGDPPFRLEESLRNQYACFFDLEREDGLTTHDLIKEHERRRTRKDRSISPVGKTAIGSKLNEKNAERRLSPNGKADSSSNRLNPSHSPVNRSSGGSSPDFFEMMEEMLFRSSKATTYVTFFHTSIKEFFNNEESASLSTPSTKKDGRPQVGVDPIAARLHVLKTSLKIFLDKAWYDKFAFEDGLASIKQHCAWYWQENLSKIDPAKVSKEERRALGPQLHRMLTDERVVFDWSLQYEQNNEGLQVLTDSNIKGIQKWLSDPEVIAGLDPKAKAWLDEASKNSNSPGIFEPIGRMYAKVWVEDGAAYVPTRFCFEIVQNVAYFEEGFSWNHSDSHWSQFPIEERVQKALAWANYKETAHFHRRVGSTLLTYDLNDKALEHYNQALKMESDNVETNGRIAYCLWKDGRFKESLDKSLECEKNELALQKQKLDAAKLGASNWRLYKDVFLAGRSLYSLGRVEEAIPYLLRAARAAPGLWLPNSEYFEAQKRYLEVLSNAGRQNELISFLKEMAEQKANTKYGYSLLVDFIVDQAKASLVIDWIPRAAAKCGEAGSISEALCTAIDVATSTRDSLRVLYLRLSLGSIHAYSRLGTSDSSSPETDAAIEVFSQISLVDYSPRGNIPTRQAYALSFQKLALLYKEKVLHAGIKSADAQKWMVKLEKLSKLQNDHQKQGMPTEIRGSDVNTSAIFLALFYRQQGRAKEANELLATMIMDSLSILSDDEPENDEYALDNMLCLLVAADDVRNACALSQSMRKINKAAISTPADSPVSKRTEPKLPEVQSVDSSCSQCLGAISPAEDYHVCQLCLELFCGKCFKDVIKQANNSTADNKAGVICRNDHAWFVVKPLNWALHHGEILLCDGKTMSFQDWKSALAKQWAGGVQ